MEVFATYRDGAFWPDGRFDADLCQRKLKPGARVKMEVTRPRSGKHHRFLFGLIGKAFENLPEDLTEKFPTPERLRVWAEIRCGYCTAADFVCENDEEAARVARAVTWGDEYALATIRGNVVYAFRAKSIDYASLGQDDFNELFEKMASVLAKLLGVTVEELLSETQKDAA